MAEIPELAARITGRPSSTARTRACRRCWRGARGSPHQAPLGRIGRQEGEVGGAADAAPLRRRRPVAHFEIALHDLVLMAALPALALVDGGLDDAELDPGDGGVGRAGKAGGTEADMGNEEEGGDGGEANLAAPAPPMATGEYRRRREKEPSREGPAP